MEWGLDSLEEVRVHVKKVENERKPSIWKVSWTPNEKGQCNYSLRIMNIMNRDAEVS